MKINARIEIFSEGDTFVALSPELNVSSFGNTIEEARMSLREALEAFIEECQRMGTLIEVLEESGFGRTGDEWKIRKPVAEEELAFSL